MDELLTKLYARRSPRQLVMLSAARADSSFAAESNKFASSHDLPKTEYVIVSMQPVGSESTTSTLAVGQKVKDQLRMGLSTDHGLRVELDYQGSVTNQTHVKWYSDLDILIIDTRFFSLEPPQKPESPYTGTPLNDLKQLRERAVKVIRNGFPTALINQAGTRSVSISGGNLPHKLDLIVCNWWNTNDYLKTKDKQVRGIRILDLRKNERLHNKPFLHNLRIADKDLRVNGGLRKAIRFLKSVKYDRQVQMSSYDVASIVYNMPEGMLAVPKGKEVVLADNTLKFLKSLVADSAKRTALMVPNEMRQIFGDEGATEGTLRSLIAETAKVVIAAKQELAESPRTLIESAFHY